MTLPLDTMAIRDRECRRAIPDHKPGQCGSVPCPMCAGEIHYATCAQSGALFAACTSEGCFKTGGSNGND